MGLKNANNILAQKIKNALILIIKAYKKVISPLLGSSCRFSPSCSQYAQEALERYGVIVGMSRAFWRVLRCNPFSRGGYDPVDEKEWHKEEV